MEEKKENKLPKINVKKKYDDLKFNFLEVVILIFITALVSITVNITINKLKADDGLTIDQNADIDRFVEEYNFVLEKYYGDISSESLINNAIAGMVNGLEDPYSSFIDDETATNFDVELDGQFYGLGVEITINGDSKVEVVGVLSGTGAEAAGIQIGDIITHMDGESIAGLSTTEFRSKMLTNNKEVVSLTVVRGEETKEIAVTRQLVEINSVTSEVYETNGKKIGYLRISIFASNTYKQFKQVLSALETQQIDSLIVDVRSNTGGHLSVVTDIISEFLDSTHVIYQEKDSNGVTKEYSSGSLTKTYPIAVLIDGASASASELLASALKEQYGAKLVGTKSFGKSTVQQVVDLNNGSKYKITIKEWLTSEGKVINGNGLLPDIPVTLTQEYFEEPISENDAQLQEAIKLFAE
ncbi:MAG: S41 family peptidase [Bacilli bacterium]|nr:S41 family peptidase [Bacilli bacterium]